MGENKVLVQFFTGAALPESAVDNGLYFIVKDGKGELYKGKTLIAETNDLARIAAVEQAIQGLDKELDDHVALYEALVGTVNGHTGAINAFTEGATLKSFKEVEDALAGKQATGDYATKAEAQAMADGKDASIKEAKDAADAAQLAAEGAQDAADAAQADVNELVGKVGTVPEGSTVMGIIANIQENAYDDTELRGLISDNTDAIDAIEADYLKTADKTELSGAITAETNRATGAEEALAGRIKAVEDDYLKAADKTELDGKIQSNTNAINTLNGEGEGSVKKSIDDAINKFATDVTNDDVVNSYKELIDWVAEHGPEAAEMAAGIEANKTSIEELEALVGSLPEGEDSATIVAFIQKLVAAEEGRATGVEEGLDERLTVVEDALKAEGDTAKAIAAAQAKADSAYSLAQGTQGEVDQLELVVADKAAQADLEAVEVRVGTAEGDIEALEELVGTTSVQSQITTALSTYATKEELNQEVARATGVEEQLINALTWQTV